MKHSISAVITTLLAIVHLAASMTDKHDLNSNINKSNSSSVEVSNINAATGPKSSRGGRMLDLDHLAGDIGKEEKLAKERSMSGQRQSRILSEDLIPNGGRTGKKNKGKRKMEIKGFIPIVSLESSKDTNPLDSSNEEEEDSDSSVNEQINQPFTATGTKEQLMSNYGGQTSIGHASFPSMQTNQWQQVAPSTEESGYRSNRKLLGSNGILGSLTSSKRLVSTLIPPGPLPQASMNVPPMIQGTDDCICVPFFQCRNGYLSESQLSKSQIHQITMNSGGHQSSNMHQIPHALNMNTQQFSDMYYTNPPQISSPQSQQDSQHQLTTNPINKDPQIAEEIYDQLRKTIEMENLEQQFQRQQQQQNYPLLDERSKSGSSQPETNTTDNVEERSLLNPMGRRSGFQGQKSCGIMRTCCKIAPQMVHSLNQNHMPQMIPIRTQQNSRIIGQPMNALRPQAQHQFLQPQTAHQFNQAQNQHIQDYQPATSALVPTRHQERPIGSFMAGRCGTKQTLGISGRVQNVQPAPGSESTAEFGEFPSHVAILKRLSPGDSLFVCSAVLVSNRWLATAAHCIRKHRSEDLKVRLGEWDVNRDDEFYPFVETNIREIIIHPDFQPSSLINDIALLRMETTIDQQQMPHITPACLAQPEEQFAGQRCWVTGWGKDAFGQGGTFQSVLKKVDLPMVGRHECESALRYQTKLGKFFRLHSSALCAGGESGKDACEGDGGAGLYCSDPESGLTKVAGLVSWGIGCGQRGVPGVYTNLASFYHWIEHTISVSGEDIYQDRNSQGLSESTFKNIINERSNQAISVANGTQPIEAKSVQLEHKATTNDSAPSSQELADKDIESRAG